LETLAAVTLLHKYVPDIKIRVVNVVDLLALQPPTEHPHGLSDEEFDAIFTTNKPIIFAFHGYPWLIHRLTYRRNGHDFIHVRGYKEEGTTTTPFDMTVLNNMDRFQLAYDAIRRVERFQPIVGRELDRLQDSHQRHKAFVMQNGEDMPEIAHWKWQAR
jgi:xylulose-5-phosphate/fructose-6-phosphate phosphoketolase